MTVKEYNNSVQAFSDNIFRFALKHLKNEMFANDIVQDTFTKVWLKHDEVSYEKVKSYLFTTAYHAIIDLIKKEKRVGDIEQYTEKGNDMEAFGFDIQEHLNEALNRLPEIQKTVVMLRDYEGYNYAEIAEITSLTEAQVKVYIFRARKGLKSYLKSLELLV